MRPKLEKAKGLEKNATIEMKVLTSGTKFFNKYLLGKSNRCTNKIQIQYEHQ